MDESEIYRRLVAKAYLFEDPAAYAAGVADTLEALGRLDGLRAALSDLPDGEAERVLADPLRDIAAI